MHLRRRFDIRTILIALAAGVPTWCAGSVFDRPSAGEVPLGITVEHEHVPERHLWRLKFHEKGRDDFHAWADLTEGELVIFIRARRQGLRSPTLFGRDVIRITLHEFGSRVRTIDARWTEGDNREAYDLARAEGWSRRAAAAQTWTARTLARYGYTCVGPVREAEIYPGTIRVGCTFRKPLRIRCAEALTKVRDLARAKFDRP